MGVGGGKRQEKRKNKDFFFFKKDKTQRDKQKTITIEEREDSHIFKGLVQNLPEKQIVTVLQPLIYGISNVLGIVHCEFFGSPFFP